MASNRTGKYTCSCGFVGKDEADLDQHMVEVCNIPGEIHEPNYA